MRMTKIELSNMEWIYVLDTMYKRITRLNSMTSEVRKGNAGVPLKLMEEQEMCSRILSQLRKQTKSFRCGGDEKEAGAF